MSSTPINPINKTIELISSLKEDTGAIILSMFILIIIILAAVYNYYHSAGVAIPGECKTMDNLYGTINGHLKNMNKSDPNCQYNLRDYYIKSAYNCCSIGDYKNDYVSICALKDIIKQGVRCLDFEIYSVDDKPVVATSTQESYFVKETYNYVPFSDVLLTIQNYAFSAGTCPNPGDPLLVHLRIKSTNQTMYQNFANLFKQYDQLFLGPETSFENGGHNLTTTPILQLCNQKKIILVVDKLNDSFMENADFYEYVNITSNSMFMRALHYYDVANTPDMSELQEYNKMSMTIAMPDNGSSPKNPNTIVCREMGCQMVAMRYQSFDTFLEEDTLYFDEAGYAFVLKPERLRYIPVTIPDPPAPNPNLSYATKTIKTDYYSFKV
jgi:Phosphatidylinositol-specific phospholipase C, X domain